MNVIIPKGRHDGKTSFLKLVSYVTRLDHDSRSDIISPDTPEPAPSVSAAARFSRLVSYIGREGDDSLSTVISDNGTYQQVQYGAVVCETNCFSVETAAAEMDMTAAGNVRCEDPVYHFILTWQTGERPEREAVFRSVRHCLDSLGMGQHQYVAAIHDDTDNLHCHVSVNRIHPETLRAQSVWKDADTLQRCCRVLERELGFRVDNGSWRMDEDGSLHRVRRTKPAVPQGAAKLEAFSDRESLYTYAVREIRDVIDFELAEYQVGWRELHSILRLRGLGVREQSGGLAVYNLLQPDGASVKASDIHPALSLPAMQRRSGDFQPAPPYEAKWASSSPVHNHYNPQLHVRDQAQRLDRREERAVARTLLRARYEAYKCAWQPAEGFMSVRERYQALADTKRQRKAEIRADIRDPGQRRLLYRVAEFDHMKARATLRLQLREEREAARTAGVHRPLSLRLWVEREALAGDRAAVSQLRGWAYRDKRQQRQQVREDRQPDAVVTLEPADDAPALATPAHDLRLHRNGTVEYQRNGVTDVADYGDRIEVYPRSEADQDTWWLAAALTARRSGNAVAVHGELPAVRRLLDTGAVLNTRNPESRFSVSHSGQSARVRETEAYFRQRQTPQERRQDEYRRQVFSPAPAEEERPKPRYDTYRP